MFLTNNSPDLYALALYILFRKKNNLFLARFQLIRMDMIDDITSRLSLIFLEILNFQKTHNRNRNSTSVYSVSSERTLFDVSRSVLLVAQDKRKSTHTNSKIIQYSLLHADSLLCICLSVWRLRQSGRILQSKTQLTTLDPVLGVLWKHRLYYSIHHKFNQQQPHLNSDGCDVTRQIGGDSDELSLMYSGLK